MDKAKAFKIYLVSVIVAGTACVIAAILALDTARFDLNLMLLALFTVAIGSRMTVKIPQFKSHISASDTFIFLILLYYGGEIAVPLAAAEAAASAWRFCSRKSTVIFNAAAMALSLSAVVVILKGFGFYTAAHLHGTGDYRGTFLILLSLLAVTQFLVNTLLAATYDALKTDIPLWATWKSKYIWSFFTYFLGAACAGLLTQLAEVLDLGIIMATFPAIFFIFLTYRMYLRNIEISVQQAEQAEQYAKVLETQSAALRESEERFRSAFDHAPIGIGLVSPDGSWLKVNRALVKILGYSEEEFLSTNFQSMILAEDLGRVLLRVHELLTGKITSCQMEQRCEHRSGRIVWTSWSVSTAYDAKSEQPDLIFQIQDITEKRSTEQKLKHEATHDRLTGLPNRALFTDRLNAALATAEKRSEHSVSVLFIDLDRFKEVNDSLGHHVGDVLLKQIARRLRNCTRPSDLIARLGGDEFTILVEGEYQDSEVTSIAERIHDQFGLVFELDGDQVYSSASIGILHANDNHRTAEDVIRDADTAMYYAKRAGRARHEIYSGEMLNPRDLRRDTTLDETAIFS